MTRFLRKFPLLGLALAGVLALSACGAPAAGNSQAQPHTITVNGSGTVYGAPDIATAQIGVQSRHADPAQAVSANNQKMADIIAALKALGIDEKDIRTTNFSVYAQQDYRPETGQPKDTFTYVVDNTVGVTVRDLDQVGEVLGRAVEAGANSIHGVNYSVSDPAALEAQARDKAMAEAKARAEQLARAAGVTLDKPMTIGEYSSGPAPLAMAEVVVERALDAAAVPVASGQIQVNVQVTVSYLIK